MEVSDNNPIWDSTMVGTNGSKSYNMSSVQCVCSANEQRYYPNGFIMIKYLLNTDWPGCVSFTVKQGFCTMCHSCK